MLNKENNPWLGLASYEYEDAYRFFGREKELERLKDCICNNLITTIYGISGAGKTSLINAGMCPLIEKEDYLPIRIRLEHNSSKTYSEQIIKAVSEAITKAHGEIETIDQLADMERVPESERLWMFFYTSTFWSASNHHLCPVVFIDQFEEIFTKNDNDEIVRTFFDSISSLQYDTPPATIAQLLENEERHTSLNAKLDFRIVLTMREDFLARLEDYAYDSPALRKNRIGIKRMNGTQALEVITRPQPGLVSRDVALKIIAKVAGREIKDTPIFLEQLSVDTSILSLFCSEVYLKAAEQQQSTITSALIDQFGEDILASFYVNTMKLVPKRTADYLETHLLTRSGFRNAVAMEDIVADDIPKEDLDKLSAKRLIRIETSEGTERVEFTHDVLCAIAKEHRNKALERNNRKQSSTRAIGFLFDLLLPLLFILPLVFCFYTNNSLLDFYDSIDGIAFYASLIILLFNTFILFPYRHSKERNASFTSIVSFVGNTIAELCLAVVYQEETPYSYESDSFKRYLAIVLAATSIYLLIHCIRSFSFSRKRSFKEAMRYTLRCRVYKDHPEMASLLKAGLLIIVWFISFIVGLSMNFKVAYFTAPLCGLATFWLLSSLLGQTTQFKWKSIFIYVAQAALIVGILISQFHQHHQVITLLIMAMLLALTVVYVLDDKVLMPLKKKIRNILVIWALAFVVTPTVNAGYNLFNLTQYHLSRNYLISNYQLMRFLVIEGSNNKLGVRDRWNIVVPVEYDDVIPTVSIDLDQNRLHGLLKLEQNISNPFYSYSDDYSTSSNEIIFQVYNAETDEEWDFQNWFCSQHLDIPNICTRTITDVSTGSCSNMRSFVATHKTLEANLLNSTIEQYLKKHEYKKLDTASYYKGLAYFTLFTGNFARAEQYARVSLKADSIHSNTRTHAVLFSALYLQDKHNEAVETVKAYEERGLFDAESDNFSCDNYYLFYNNRIAEYIEYDMGELSDYEVINVLVRDRIDSLLVQIGPYLYDNAIENSDSVLNYIDKYKGIVEPQQIEKVINAYNKKYDLYDNLENRYSQLAYFTLFTGDFAKAEQYAREAIKANPYDIIAFSNLFDALYIQYGANEEAVSIFDTYKNDTINTYTFEEGVIKDFDKLELYGVIEPSVKDSFDLFHLQEESFIYNKAIKDSNGMRAFIVRYKDIASPSQIEQVIERFNDEHGYNKDRVQYYNEYAYFTLFTGDFAKAEQYAREAIKANPSYVLAYTNLFDALYLQYGANKEVLSIYETYKDTTTENHDSFKESIAKDFRFLELYEVIEQTEKEKFESFIEEH